MVPRNFMSPIKLIVYGIPVLSLVWLLWADRRLSKWGAGRGWRIVLGMTIFVLMAGFAWVLMGRTDVVATAVPIPTPLYALVLLWGVIFLPLLALPSMLGWSLWSLGRRIFQRKPVVKVKVETEGRKWTRRELLGTVAVGMPVLATFGAAAFNLPRMTRFRIREMTVSVKDLPQALDGMRIAHVTDTHVGKFTRGKVLGDIAAATNRLEADLVLFTGDLIDNSIHDLPSAVKMLQSIKPGAGMFVIEGNHDLFDNPAAFRKGVLDGGLKLLRNEAATVAVRGVPVQLLGTVWSSDEQEIIRDVDAVAKLRDPAAFQILMAHHPHAFDRAAKQGFPLILAGHTHGGQLMLTPEFGAGSLMFRYWSGLYQKASSSLVVSNGVGNWFPMRVNAPAEIIHLTLRKA
jgi:predicted MPP superfamily phosphohydrolase